MAKNPHVPDLDANVPDDWELVSSLEGDKEQEPKPTKKRGFKRWDSGAFLAAEPDKNRDAAVPSNAVQNSASLVGQDEFPLLTEFMTPSVVEPMALSPEGVAQIANLLLGLVSRLPAQYAPSLDALDAVLHGGGLLVFNNGEVDLSGLQAFFEEQMGWTEHRFQTFCKPLLPQLQQLGYRLRRVHVSSTELPGLGQELLPQGGESELLGRSVTPGTDAPISSTSSAAVERVTRLSSPSVEVPTIASSISEDDIPTPIPVGAKESVLVFLLDCVRRSPVRSLLDIDVLQEYLEDHLADMWKKDAFDLQMLWDKLHEVPHLSEALMLSVFAEIEKHQKDQHYPLRLPKEVSKDLSKKAAASVHYRPLDGGGEAQKPQVKPRPVVERIHAPGKKNQRTSPMFLVVGSLLILAGAYYLLFVMNAGPSVRGERVDPKRYASLLPLSKATFHKPSFTLYVQITKDVMQWESARRVRAIYALHRFSQQHDQVRVLKILKPNGELYASLGRMN